MENMYSLRPLRLCGESFSFQSGAAAFHASAQRLHSLGVWGLLRVESCVIRVAGCESKLDSGNLKLEYNVP